MRFFLHIFLIGAIIIGFAMIGTAFARDTIVVITPDGTPAAKQVEIERLAKHVLQNVGPGETALVLDGRTLAPIASFAVPEGAAYANVRAKARANAAFFRALKLFAETARPSTGQPGLIDLPGVLTHIGDYHRAEGPADLILLGVPLVHDPKQPSLSMLGGAVPNDGHLLAPPAQSPFGTAGRDDRLQGYRVLIGMPDSDWTIHDIHFEAVKRWAAHAVSLQGGVLAAFSDPETAYAQAGGDGPGLAVAPIVPTDKREMVAFAPDVADLPVIYDREITTEVPSDRTLRFAEGVEIGITWGCDACDLDLWAVPHPGAEPVYFGNPVTREGRLFKDHTRSPSITAGYETIAFREPVNLAELVLAVNFYGGAAGPDGVTGEVRIAIGQRTWAAPFTIAATSGNQSQGAEAALTAKTAPNTAWVLLDPPAILGRH